MRWNVPRPQFGWSSWRTSARLAPAWVSIGVRAMSRDATTSSVPCPCAKRANATPSASRHATMGVDCLLSAKRSSHIALPRISSPSPFLSSSRGAHVQADIVDERMLSDAEAIEQRHAAFFVEHRHRHLHDQVPAARDVRAQGLGFAMRQARGIGEDQDRVACLQRMLVVEQMRPRMHALPLVLQRDLERVQRVVDRLALGRQRNIDRLALERVQEPRR